MKINEKINYVSPKVEVVKVKIEKGFSYSDPLNPDSGIEPMPDLGDLGAFDAQ